MYIFYCLLNARLELVVIDVMGEFENTGTAARSSTIMLRTD